MSRKALHLVVNLEIQAVTCPGVWLCPNGNVQLLFSMLGLEVRTKKLPPVFPLLFHEKLTFEKTFPSAGCLAEVQDALGREDVYAVLLQEVEGSTGGAVVQLARFHSSALHILYPSPCSKGLLAGVDVDLLMEASTDYPGILCPKIELATKTVVKEVTSSVNDGYIINPKTLSSQKKICPQRPNSGGDVRTIHSDGRYLQNSKFHPQHGKRVRNHHGSSHIPRFHRSSCPARAHVSQLHLNAHQGGHVFCSGKSCFQDAPCESQELCQCGAGHLATKCPLCTQYKAVFSSLSDFPESFEDRHQIADKLRKKQEDISTFEKTKRLSKALHAHVDRILDPSADSILSEGHHYNSHIPHTSSEVVTDRRVPKYRPNHRRVAEEQASEYSNTSNARGEAYQSDPHFHDYGAGDEFNSHRQLFYANLEKFYRKLYNKVKTRAQEENLLHPSSH